MLRLFIRLSPYIFAGIVAGYLAHITHDTLRFAFSAF